MIFGAILAGGIGTRIGFDVPKQFTLINNKPLLTYSIKTFNDVEEFDKIIVSSPKDYLDKTNDVIKEYFPNNEKIVVIEGGQTRNDTILNSIEYAKKNGANKDSILVTHDAARIFVTTNLIRNSIVFAKKYGAASSVIPSTDVIFESIKKGELNDIPLRKNLFRAQTPQSFKINNFINIYNTLSEDEIKKLDEAMALFFLKNQEVYLFEGDDSNFKITNPFDIEIAKTYIKKLKN